MFGLVSRTEMVRRVFTRAIKCCGLSSSTINPSTWNFRAGRDVVFLQFEILLSFVNEETFPEWSGDAGWAGVQDVCVPLGGLSPQLNCVNIDPTEAATSH